MRLAATPRDMGLTMLNYILSLLNSIVMFYNFESKQVVNPFENISRVAFIGSGENTVRLMEKTTGVDGFVIPELVRVNNTWLPAWTPNEVFQGANVHIQWTVAGFSGTISCPQINDKHFTRRVGFQIHGHILLIGIYAG